MTPERLESRRTADDLSNLCNSKPEELALLPASLEYMRLNPTQPESTFAGPSRTTSGRPLRIKCPLTGDVMNNPVVALGDGQTCEYAAMAMWQQLEANSSCIRLHINAHQLDSRVQMSF